MTKGLGLSGREYYSTPMPYEVKYKRENDPYYQEHHSDFEGDEKGYPKGTYYEKRRAWFLNARDVGARELEEENRKYDPDDGAPAAWLDNWRRKWIERAIAAGMTREDAVEMVELIEGT